MYIFLILIKIEYSLKYARLMFYLRVSRLIRLSFQDLRLVEARLMMLTCAFLPMRTQSMYERLYIFGGA